MFQSRYYDPANHRFINADVYTSTDISSALASNMFAYCQNNPVVYGDESGEFLGWLIGATVGAVTGAIDAAIKGENILAGAAGGAVNGAITGAASDLILLSGGTAAPVVMGVASAAGSFAGNFVKAKVAGNDFDVAEAAKDAIWDGLTGALFTYMGGPIKAQSGKSVGQIVSNEVRKIPVTIAEGLLENAVSKAGRFTLKILGKMFERVVEQ